MSGQFETLVTAPASSPATSLPVSVVGDLLALFPALTVNGIRAVEHAAHVVYADIEPISQAESRIYERGLMMAAYNAGVIMSVGSDEMFGSVRTLRFEALP